MAKAKQSTEMELTVKDVRKIQAALQRAAGFKKPETVIRNAVKILTNFCPDFAKRLEKMAVSKAVIDYNSQRSCI